MWNQEEITKALEEKIKGWGTMIASTPNIDDASKRHRRDSINGIEHWLKELLKANNNEKSFYERCNYFHALLQGYIEEESGKDIDYEDKMYIKMYNSFFNEFYHKHCVKNNPTGRVELSLDLSKESYKKIHQEINDEKEQVTNGSSLLTPPKAYQYLNTILCGVLRITIDTPKYCLNLANGYLDVIIDKAQVYATDVVGNCPSYFPKNPASITDSKLTFFANKITYHESLPELPTPKSLSVANW